VYFRGSEPADFWWAAVLLFFVMLGLKLVRTDGFDTHRAWFQAMLVRVQGT
jgi:hypothetical protein